MLKKRKNAILTGGTKQSENKQDQFAFLRQPTRMLRVLMCVCVCVYVCVLNVCVFVE